MAEGVADRKGLCRMEVLAGVGGLEYAVRKNREKKEESPDGRSSVSLSTTSTHTFWIPGGMVCHQACADAAACQKKEIFLGFLEIPRYFLRK